MILKIDPLTNAPPFLFWFFVSGVVFPSGDTEPHFSGNFVSLIYTSSISGVLYLRGEQFSFSIDCNGKKTSFGSKTSNIMQSRFKKISDSDGTQYRYQFYRKIFSKFPFSKFDFFKADFMAYSIGSILRGKNIKYRYEIKRV